MAIPHPGSDGIRRTPVHEGRAASCEYNVGTGRKPVRLEYLEVLSDLGCRVCRRKRLRARRPRHFEKDLSPHFLGDLTPRHVPDELMFQKTPFRVGIKNLR